MSEERVAAEVVADEEVMRIKIPPGLEHQVEFWNDNTPEREIAVIGPLGTGKTFSLLGKAVLLSLINRPLLTALVVPTYSMFNKVHRLEWPIIAYDWGIPVSITGGPSPVIRWPWGSLTYIYSADRPEMIVASNLAAALGDEPALWPREAYERITARIRHPGAKIRQLALAGSPEGIPSWVADEFDIYDIKKDEASGWSTRTIRARTWHPTMKHYIARLRKTFAKSPALLDTYARGLFVPMYSGRCYPLFDPAVNIAKTEYTSGSPLYLTCDFNIDAMRWYMLQFIDGRIIVLDEFAPGANTPVQDVCDQVAVAYQAKHGMKVQHQNSLVILGDAAGRQRSHAGTVNYDIMVKKLRGAFRSVSVQVPQRNPRVADRIAAVNHAFSEDKILIDPSCEDLIRDLQVNVWREGVAEVDTTDKMRTHASSALGYGVVELIGLRVARARPRTSEVAKRSARTKKASQVGYTQEGW